MNSTSPYGPVDFGLYNFMKDLTDVTLQTEIANTKDGRSSLITKSTTITPKFLLSATHFILTIQEVINTILLTAKTLIINAPANLVGRAVSCISAKHGAQVVEWSDLAKQADRAKMSCKRAFQYSIVSLLSWTLAVYDTKAHKNCLSKIGYEYGTNDSAIVNDKTKNLAENKKEENEQIKEKGVEEEATKLLVEAKTLQITELSKQKIALEKQVAEILSKLNNKNVEFTKLVNDKIKENATLVDEKGALEKKLAEIQLKLTKVVNELKAQIENLSIQLKLKNEEIDKLKINFEGEKGIATLVDEKGVLEKKLAEIQPKLTNVENDLKAQIESLNILLKLKNEEIDQLKQSVDAEKHKHQLSRDALTESFETLQHKCVALENAFTDKNEKMKDLEDDNQAVRLMLKEEMAISSKTKEIVELYKVRTSDLTRDLAETTDKYNEKLAGRWEFKYHELNDKFKDLKQNHDNNIKILQQKHDDLERECKSLNTQYILLEKEYDGVKSKKTTPQKNRSGIKKGCDHLSPKSSTPHTSKTTPKSPTSTTIPKSPIKDIKST